jgi:hypothetical protein
MIEKPSDDLLSICPEQRSNVVILSFKDYLGQHHHGDGNKDWPPPYVTPT